jgi:hypothetical protein
MCFKTGGQLAPFFVSLRSEKRPGFFRKRSKDKPKLVEGCKQDTDPTRISLTCAE